MAKQINGVYEAVLECAKQEFLKKGYTDASLRVIAQGAGTSTSSIYTRFGDKEGLFRHIVEPAAEGMKTLFWDIQNKFSGLDEEIQRTTVGEYSIGGMDHILDYMYEHFDEFSLLLDASYGTLFQNFVHDLVDIEVECTFSYMKVIGCERGKSSRLTEEFLHIIVTAFMNGMFEVIRHPMKQEDARRYLNMLSHYHRAGFETIFSDLEDVE